MSWQDAIIQNTLAKNKMRAELLKGHAELLKGHGGDEAPPIPVDDPGKLKAVDPEKHVEIRLREPEDIIETLPQWVDVTTTSYSRMPVRIAVNRPGLEDLELKEVDYAAKAILKVLPNDVRLTHVSKQLADDGSTMFMIAAKENDLKNLVDIEEKDRVLLDLVRAGNALLSSLETLIDEGDGRFARLVAKERDDWRRARDRVFDGNEPVEKD